MTKPSHIAVPRIGRKRRVAGWMLVSLGLLVAGVWAWSGWSSFRWQSARWVLWIQEGCVGVEHSTNFRRSDLRAFGFSLNLPDNKVVGFQSLAWRARGWQANPIMDAPYRAPFTTDLGLVGIANINMSDLDGWTYDHHACVLVLWPLPLCLLVAGAWMAWTGELSRRRIAANRCVRCGYSLAGLATAAGAVRPECGVQVDHR